MRISTKGRYALRLMVEIALHDGKATTISEIAANQEISDKYLEQIVALLNKNGLVKSTRGAGGGYRLVKAPEEYSVGEILRVAEGSLAPAECLDANGVPCERENICVTKNLFVKIENAVNQVIDNISLKDLMEDELAVKDDSSNRRCVQ